MTSSATKKAKNGFTLIELLVVMAIIAIILAMLGPALYSPSGSKPTRVMCMSNLKQIGLGFWIYSEENSNQPPWQISLRTDSTAAGCFLNLTSYLRQPNIFVCPSDKTRKAAATNYLNFNNTNLSYFAALHSTLNLTSNPAMLILAGDRHLAFNNQPVKSGLLSVSNPATVSWTKELHYRKDTTQFIGVMLFADGHAESVMAHRLTEKFQAQATATNRLLIP
jgi:prepilin-type N-terminal cleavage/methylation domain-containing protein